MKSVCRSWFSAIFFALSFLLLASCSGGGGIGTLPYRYEPAPGKTIGFWPDNWTVERLTLLRTRYGFNYVIVPAERYFYNNALAAGFLPSNIAVGFSYGGAAAAVDSFDSPIYYVDEAVEHKCNGEPTAGPIHTPAELAVIRDYVHLHRPGAKFISSGYKRCSHLRILGTFVDNIMYSSYKNWTSLNLPVCTPNLGWGDILESGWVDTPSDQSKSWTAMRDLFQEKFSMTWIRGREDEYETLLPHANSLGLKGLWLFHGEPIDTTLLVNFCNAAFENGWMLRIPLGLRLNNENSMGEGL